MANKIIAIANTDKTVRSNYSLEVWRDIDTSATDNLNYRYTHEVYLSDYVKYLVTEKGNLVNKSLDNLSNILCENLLIDDADPYSMISAIAVEVAVGYDQALDLYEKFMQPYRFRIAKLINVKAVMNSIHNIFTWTPGERILDPEFGSRLKKYLYEGITEHNTEQIMAEIRSCVLKYEPRANIVNVVNVSTIEETEDNTVHLEIIFTIPSLDDEQYAYSYYYKRGDQYN